MQIFRWNNQMFNISTDVKPEPWLHIAMQVNKYGVIRWAIYVWDTREIIDEGVDHVHIPEWQPRHTLFEGLTRAKDNHQPLKGKNAAELNKLFHFTA